MGRNAAITVAALAEAIKVSKSWASVCRILGIPPATGSQTHTKKRAAEAGMDFSHFSGTGWNRGQPAPNRRPIAHYLVKGGPFINSDTLKKRLFKEGIRAMECEDCHIRQWRGEDAPLELDHVDSDRSNNTLENLSIRCPNCHALKTAKQRSELKSGKAAPYKEANPLGSQGVLF